MGESLPSPIGARQSLVKGLVRVVVVGVAGLSGCTGADGRPCGIGVREVGAGGITGRAERSGIDVTDVSPCTNRDTTIGQVGNVGGGERRHAGVIHITLGGVIQHADVGAAAVVLGLDTVGHEFRNRDNHQDTEDDDDDQEFDQSKTFLFTEHRHQYNRLQLIFSLF